MTVFRGKTAVLNAISFTRLHAAGFTRFTVTVELVNGEPVGDVDLIEMRALIGGVVPARRAFTNSQFIRRGESIPTGIIQARAHPDLPQPREIVYTVRTGSDAEVG